MSDHDLDPAIVEAVAKAMADDWDPERDPILTAMFRDYAQSALAAAAPLIRAQALREFAGDLEIECDNAQPENPNAFREGAHEALNEAMEMALARADREAHDAWCPHPKCPGGALCCCGERGRADS